MRGLILGTGPSLQRDLVPHFDGLIFGPNNTYQDFPLDVWLACDPTWHQHYGQVSGDFDKWHWDKGICNAYGYTYVEGVWMIDGCDFSRDKYLTPPAPCGGLWMQDKSKISLNHCSGAQLLNLAANQYECDEIVLVGHDFSYSAGKRHYFADLSDKPGEYPEPLRKFSEFDKQGKGDDLLAVYRRIADQDGLPPIINCTPGSKLPWFEFGNLEDYLR